MMHSDVRWLPLAPAAAVRSTRTARLAAGPWGTLAGGAAAGQPATARPQAIEFPDRCCGRACGAWGWAAFAGRGL